MASPEADSISWFFERHSSYEKYFYEDVKTVVNKWVTEVHLSFYQRDNTSHIFGDRDSRTTAGFPDSPDTGSPSVLGSTVGSSDLESTEDPSSAQDIDLGSVRQAAMSFRFDGDFFDRYWICHYVENQRESTQESYPTHDIVKEQQETAQKDMLRKEPWKQRKVLELILFERILQKMVACSKEILKEARESVLKSPKSSKRSNRPAKAPYPGHSVRQDELNTLSDLNNDEFIATSQKWGKVQHLLQVVQENIDENLGVIDLWKIRESEREPDRPRWTRDDERRYRSSISKWSVLTDHKIQDLRRVHASMKLFSTSLANKLDMARGELELRDAENIGLFTYVTVVFLPISFATGLFSMSEAPSTKVGLSMLVTALAALTATAVALFNAKLLAQGIIGPAMEWGGKEGHKLIKKSRPRVKKPASDKTVVAENRPRRKPSELWFKNAPAFISNRFKRHPRKQTNDPEA